MDAGHSVNFHWSARRDNSVETIHSPDDSINVVGSDRHGNFLHADRLCLNLFFNGDSLGSSINLNGFGRSNRSRLCGDNGSSTAALNGITRSNIFTVPLSSEPAVPADEEWLRKVFLSTSVVMS